MPRAWEREPDLDTQYESLLDEVWKREREQDFFRRLYAQVDQEEQRRKRRKPRR